MSASVAMMVNEFPALPETFVLNQIAGLIDRGYRVDIIPIDRINGPEQIHPIVERYDMMRLVRPLPPLAHGRLPAIAQLIRHTLTGPRRYDVVHAQFGNVGLHALRLLRRRILAGKLITCFRGFDISRYLLQKPDGVYIPLFQRGDLFLTNCHFFERRLRRLGCPADRLFVNPSGIEADRFEFRPRSLSPGETVRIVSVGRLVAKKGFGFAINALHQAITRGLDATFTIVGEGHLRQKLEAQIARLGLTDRVRLIGHRPQDEVIATLNDAHLFLAPSVTATDGDQDGPTNTLKEAMAMGLPVLATRHGGIPEMVTDLLSGYLVEENDAPALTDRLLQIVAEADRWPDIGRYNRDKIVRCYDSARTNAHLAEIYDAVLNDSFDRCTSMYAHEPAEPQPTA